MNIQISTHFYNELSTMTIAYPPYSPRIKKEEGKEYIFDAIRKKWVMITPEEWVRQNFINYLIVSKKYPASLIAVEKEILVGEMRKRFDILIYKNANPWMLIECKEMQTPVNDLAIKQVVGYNIQLQVPYLIITNGNNTLGVLVKEGHVSSLENIPNYV